MIACEQTGRICYGVELEEKFADVIVNRFIEVNGDSSGVFLLRKGMRVSYEDVKKAVEHKTEEIE